MKVVIVTSAGDLAGMNIIDNLNFLNCKIPIKIIDEEHIHANNIDKELDADFIVFASKHVGKEDKSTLTVHPIGNFHEAKFGGEDEKICPSSSLILKHFFQTLKKNNDLDYEVTMEATHHGPFINTPSLYIEIGPSEKQWKDKNAGKVIAKTIIESIESFKEKEHKIAFGVGGPHYCPNFNEIQLGNKFAISHIIPSYALPISKEVVKQIISKTSEKIKYLLIDWKGLKSEQRNNFLDIIKDFDLEIIKTKEAKIN